MSRPATGDEAAVARARGEALERLRREAIDHPLWRHPFLERCRGGELTVREVRVLAGQMYKFSREFARLLAEILTWCPDEAARVVIAENLFEELGEGDGGRTHAELFRRFTRALGITDVGLHATPTEPETRALIDTYLGLAERYGWLPALGAVCFASEGIVAALYTQLETGIQDAAGLPREALVFFDVHVAIDGGHADKLAAVVAPHLNSEEEIVRVACAIREAMDARSRFFDGVARRARVATGLTGSFVRAREAFAP